MDAEGNVIRAGATVLEPLGTLFLNMMFCIVVPMVFSSIAGSVATMKSRKRAGKIMGTTVLTFVVTGAVAAVIMFIVMKLVPPVLEPWTDMATEAIGEHASLADMIVNFFTTDDFVGLLSRSAMLPLIVFSILFGFATNLVGGPDHVIGKFLDGLTEVMMAFVKIITYYAPIAFFALFADLVATYGSSVASAYGRAMAGARDKVCFQIHFGANYQGGMYGWTTDLDTIKRSIDWQLRALKNRLYRLRLPPLPGRGIRSPDGAGRRRSGLYPAAPAGGDRAAHRHELSHAPGGESGPGHGDPGSSDVQHQPRL